LLVRYIKEFVSHNLRTENGEWTRKSIGK
jgi:hypothetical protein